MRAGIDPKPYIETPQSEWAKRLWRLLVEPVKPSKAPMMQIHLLSLLLLLLIPALVTSIFWNASLVGSEQFHLFLLLASIFTTIAYVFNRFGYYTIGASIVVFFLSALPYVALLFNHDFSMTKIVLITVCIVPGIIAAYLLFSLRGTAISVLLSLIALLLIPVFMTDVSYADIIFPLYFSITVAALMLIAAVVRENYERRLIQGQHELSESEVRYRDLFEATFEPMAIHDQGIITDANPALARLLHVSLAEVLGRSVTDFVHPDDRDDVRMRGREPDTQAYEARLISKDGRVLNVEIRAKIHRYRGRSQRVVSIRDISLSKQAESHQIELAVEREKVNVLQRFIGNMSHDLRTPLTVIKTSLYLFKRMPDEPDKQAQQIETLEGQVEHLQRLFDDLLSMSKLDKADTSDYQFKWININKPTLTAVEDQRLIAKRRGQRIEFQPGDDLPNILIDENEYKRMVKHLILNGLGYTSEQGIVSVETSQIGNEVVIAVRDTGEGINPLDLPDIFDRFYRRDNIRGSADGGTGLGLNIARKIAEAHSGTIEVESELGKGSVFRVRLPVISETDARALLGDSLNGST